MRAAVEFGDSPAMKSLKAYLAGTSLPNFRKDPDDRFEVAVSPLLPFGIFDCENNGYVLCPAFYSRLNI